MSNMLLFVRCRPHSVAFNGVRLLSQSCRILNSHDKKDAHKKEKEKENLPKIDPSIYMKYREKLQQKAKETGARSYNELLKGVKHHHHHKHKEEEIETQKPDIPTKHKQKIKSLDTFVNVEKMAELVSKSDSDKELEMLWRLRFSQDANSLCAIIKPEIFGKMLINAHKYPMFVLPLANEQDNINQLHLIQWSFPSSLTTHVIMTSLAEYKLKQQFSTPHTTLVFHSDLKSNILMNGHIIPDLGISINGAHFLTLALQKIYATADLNSTDSHSDSYIRGKLLSDFSKGSPDFSIDCLLNQLDKTT